TPSPAGGRLRARGRGSQLGWPRLSPPDVKETMRRPGPVGTRGAWRGSTPLPRGVLPGIPEEAGTGPRAPRSVSPLTGRAVAAYRRVSWRSRRATGRSPYGSTLCRVRRLARRGFSPLRAGRLAPEAPPSLGRGPRLLVLVIAA